MKLAIAILWLVLVGIAASAFDLAGTWRVVYEAEYQTGESPGVGLSVPRGASAITALTFDAGGTGTSVYRDGRVIRFFYILGVVPPWVRQRGIAGQNLSRSIDILQQGTSEFFWYYLEFGDGRLLLLNPGTEESFQRISRILVVERAP